MRSSSRACAAPSRPPTLVPPASSGGKRLPVPSTITCDTRSGFFSAMLTAGPPDDEWPISAARSRPSASMKRRMKALRAAPVKSGAGSLLPKPGRSTAIARTPPAASAGRLRRKTSAEEPSELPCSRIAGTPEPSSRYRIFRPSTATRRSRSTTFNMRGSLRAKICSTAGDALPRHQLEAAGAMGNVRLAVGDLLGFGTGRGAEDDHAGAEAVACVIEERSRADQHALLIKLVDEVVMQLGQLLAAECELGRRVDDLVVDHPALLTLAHDALPLHSPAQARWADGEDSALRMGSKALRWRRRRSAARSALDGAADVPGAEHELLHLDCAREPREVFPRLDQRIAEHRVLHQPEAKRQHQPPAEPGWELGVHDHQPAARPQLIPGFAQHREVMRHGVVGQPEHHAIERNRRPILSRVTLDQCDIAPVIALAKLARAGQHAGGEVHAIDPPERSDRPA